jgi:PAS domain S-box-containing protein
LQQTIDLTIENFFRLSLDLFAICGLDGYFKQVNASFIRCIGCEEADLLEKPFIDLVHPDDRAATLGELKRLTDGLQVLQFENRYRCADGTFKWLSWMCYPSLEERLAYCVARDITEQRAARQQMKELAAELSRSNSDLAQFAYVASHDLQEPLRAVAGCVQLLAQRNQGTLDAKSQELIEHAVSGSKRMQTLINDLHE